MAAKHLPEVEALLINAGWVRDGQTDSDLVRVPTRDAPVYGGMGGELRTFGGRSRWHLPGSPCYVTVGKRTACFYKREPKGQPIGFENIPTADVPAIRGMLEIASWQVLPPSATPTKEARDAR